MGQARTDMRTRVGVIGSVKYEDKRKIKDLICKLKAKFDRDFVVVSGGRTAGADTYVKKFALEMNCTFKEFNPAHTQFTNYSILSEAYYGKPYSPRYFFHRNSMMLNYVDYLFIFQKEEDVKNPDIEGVIESAKKMNKEFVVIN